MDIEKKKHLIQKSKDGNFILLYDECEEDEEWKCIKRNYKLNNQELFFSYKNFNLFETFSFVKFDEIFKTSELKYEILEKPIFTFRDRKYNVSNLVFYGNCAKCQNSIKWEGNPSRNKRINLLCEKCHKSEFYETRIYQEKYKKTMVEKHGVERPLQSEKIHESFYKTMQFKYGEKHSILNIDSNTKRKKTNEKKYGYSNYFHLINKNLKKFKTFGPSKAELNFCDSVTKHFKEHFFEVQKSFKIPQQNSNNTDRIYFADLFNEKNNLCIEFFGDYWHANPKKYKEDDIVYSSFLAKEIWKKDKERNDAIVKTYGCYIFYVWESDFEKNPSECLRLLGEYLK